MSKFREYLEKAINEDVTQLEIKNGQLAGFVNNKPFGPVTTADFKKQRPEDYNALLAALKEKNLDISAFTADQTPIDVQISNGKAIIRDTAEITPNGPQENKQNPAMQQAAVQATQKFQKAGETVVPAGQNAPITRK